jgi:hypothetical protein
MINRRDFISGSLLAASSLGYGLKKSMAMAKFPEKQTADKFTKIPDTLDLADHGSMAINGMLGTLNPEMDYECAFLTIYDVHPAYMLHWSTMVSGVMPKYVEALPMLRQMSGSEFGKDIQKGFMKAMLNNASDDGLVYDRASKDRPWNVGVYYGKPDWNEDYANMAGNGRLLAGLTYWHQATKDPVWKKRAEKTARRMLELAIVEGQHAWYPNPGIGNDFSYPRISGWTTKKPPQKASEGFEGATLFYQFQPIRGFMRWYALSGDERFKDLSKKFVNFGLQKKFWGHPQDPNPSAGAQRAHFKGHLHGTLAALRGILDYAVIANEPEIKYFVRDGYEWVRQKGIHRLGAFPHNHNSTEGCVLGDMTGLAVALSDAGLGDYWDDVEMYARNGLISVQATDLDEMKRVSKLGKHRPKNSPWGGYADSRFTGNNKGVLPGQEIHDNVLLRAKGSFGYLAGATHLEPRLMHCCTANGSQGLYYAWEGIMRNYKDDVQINMWLNRKSPIADIFSFLPYQGKLLIMNKGAKSIYVRKPGWAKHASLRCRVNGKNVKPRWISNRILFKSLKGNEKITIETPVNINQVEYDLINVNDMKNSHEKYNCRFKGHTALEVEKIGEPVDSRKNWYKLFERDHMKSEKVPAKLAASYVPPKELIKWFKV